VEFKEIEEEREMKVIGVILMVLGVLVGLYLGVWWGFIGGIVDIVGEVKAPEIDAMVLALGVAKIIFCELIGGVPGFIIGGGGYIMYNW
jgi:hypothetical protein